MLIDLSTVIKNPKTSEVTLTHAQAVNFTIFSMAEMCMVGTRPQKEINTIESSQHFFGCLKNLSANALNL